MFKKTLSTLFGLILGLTLFAIGLLAIAVLVTYPKLPKLDAVTNYRPKMPLTIYSSDAKLIGIFGEERRSFTKINDFPKVLKQAVIAAEDKRFYDHWGVDIWGVLRAMIGNVSSGEVQSGASTITQQVAKNFFLTNERTFTRKFNEALLAYKIEQSLSKDQILELYFNQIYLGQRSYGFAAAAQAYFNKPVAELTLAEASMLAGLPKAPSAFNPIVNPERAKQRQTYILNNIQELGMISPEQKQNALAETLSYPRAQENIDENSLYVAEMARQAMYEKYGEEAYTQGFQVYTTVDSRHQEAATHALRKTLENFDRGRGFHGAEAYLDISKLKGDNLHEQLDQYLFGLHTVRDMVPAVVLKASKTELEVYVPGAKVVAIKGGNMALVRTAVNNKKMGEQQVQPGAVIRVRQGKNGWIVVQQPDLQGAIVALDAETGAIRALSGGYDFYRRSFNRATQAWRQPGSTFKPFVYSAGIAKGLTMTTPINDAPLSLPGMGPNGGNWEPKNSDGRYAGFITLNQALVASKNMVSIRILMATGVSDTQQYIQKFGLQAKDHPASLSMALGAGSATPLQMAEAYAVFANGGYKVSSYVIDRIYDGSGQLKAQTQPLIAGQTAPQAIDPRNAFIMYQMMKDVTRRGTAAAASALGRSDIAGKTGTTNDQKDAWFVGFNPKLVTAVFIGFDKPATMGRAGFGGIIALPVWMDYMRFALKGTPIVSVKPPSGLVNHGGAYYYREYQSTNPNLALDNRASAPIEPAEQDINNPDLGEVTTGTELYPNGGEAGAFNPEGGVELQPTNPAGGGNKPQGSQDGGGTAPAKNLDDLF